MRISARRLNVVERLKEKEKEAHSQLVKEIVQYVYEKPKLTIEN